MQWLTKTDLCVQATIEEDTGEIILCGVSGHHVEVLLERMTRALKSGDDAVEFAHSLPTTLLRETVTARSPTCMAKSPNRHSRTWVTAQPFPADLPEAIDRGIVATANLASDPSPLAAYGWDAVVRPRPS
jgi:elongation factor 2